MAAKGWDHGPPAKQKVTPFGVLVLLTGALARVFGAGGSSDCWAAALRARWRGARPAHRGVRRPVIDPDNGPENSGRRAQLLKRRVQFADRSGLVIRLVYGPPQHSQYTPLERCGSAVAKKGSGVVLPCGDVILPCAARMTWRQMHPRGERWTGSSAAQVRVPAEELKGENARWERSATLAAYDITITPRKPRGR